jgi:hypothetical protein
MLVIWKIEVSFTIMYTVRGFAIFDISDNLRENRYGKIWDVKNCKNFNDGYFVSYYVFLGSEVKMCEWIGSGSQGMTLKELHIDYCKDFT